MKPHEDILGHALADYWASRKSRSLKIYNNYGVPEKMAVKTFFRNYDEFPEIERFALSLCRGEILDVGAGAGRHALVLQERKLKVTALEISPLAVEVMKQRGVKKAVEGDIWSFEGKKFDTVLMLMNGVGIAGSLFQFELLLEHIKKIIKPGGQWIFDSSDISYLYDSGEKPKDRYFGEVDFQFEYQKLKGPWFKWVYIDKATLKMLAEKTGWNFQIIFENDQDEFLARLTL